jgi:hypothetical protein
MASFLDFDLFLAGLSRLLRRVPEDPLDDLLEREEPEITVRES